MATLPVKEEKLHIESVSLGDLTWVNIEEPSEKETEFLARNYHFHPFDLDDVLSKKQRPKIDEYSDYLFVIFHFNIYNKETKVSTPSQISVFIGDKYLITIHSGQIRTITKFFRECQEDEAKRRENLSHGSGYLLYRILDRATDDYFPILDKILSITDDLEDSVFDENVEASQEIALLRRDIITQRRLVFSLRSVLIQLENKIKRFSSVDMNVLWGDLLDHINKIQEELDESKEIIEVYKDTDFVLSTDRLNRIMRTLTIISTIMLPLIVLSGLWSMNVPLPFGADPGGQPYFFYIILGMLFIVVLVMLYFFHRKHWI